MDGNMRCFCRALICFLTEEIDLTDGGASEGIGVERPLPESQLKFKIPYTWSIRVDDGSQSNLKRDRRLDLPRSICMPKYASQAIRLKISMSILALKDVRA